MPKSKLYTFLPADDASSLNGDAGVSDDISSSGPGQAPARKKSGLPPGYGEEHKTSVVGAGRLPEEVYANTLPWWRAALRRKCVAVVEWETEVIGEWQVRPFVIFLFLLFFLPRLLPRGGEGMRRRGELDAQVVFGRHACGRLGWTRTFCIRRCLARTRSSSCSCPRFSFLGTTGWEEGKRTGLFVVALWLD